MISREDNLCFNLNFSKARQKPLKFTKKVVWVTLFSNFQNHSNGFKSGEFFGKNSNSSRLS